MKPSQKVLVTQLQIAGAGLIIAVFGFVWQEVYLAAFGGLIILYALARLLIMRRLMEAEEQPEQEENLDELLSQYRKADGDKDKSWIDEFK